MSRRFHSILVPIDFSVNTEVAVSKSLELLQNHPAEIHLLHVQSPGFPNLFHRVYDYLKNRKSIKSENAIESAYSKLEYLKSIVSLRHDQVKIHTWVNCEDHIEKAISQKAKRLAVDLIVIGKGSHHSVFPTFNTVVPSRLAASSGIPVLTSKAGSMNKSIKTVVIPVDMNYPATKLEMLEAFRHESMNIRLAVFTEDEKDPITSRLSLVNTFRTLRIQSANPVNYEVLTGRNRARALLKYCSKVDADVLIATAGLETKLGIWSNQHISDILPAESRMQVLTVTPH